MVKYLIQAITGMMIFLVLVFSQSPVCAQDEYQKYDIVVEINGMVCPFCSYSVEKALNNTKEIKHADVSILDGLAKLIVEKDHKITKEQFSDTIIDAGYKTGKFIKFSDETALNNSPVCYKTG